MAKEKKILKSKVKGTKTKEPRIDVARDTKKAEPLPEKKKSKVDKEQFASKRGTELKDSLAEVAEAKNRSMEELKEKATTEAKPPEPGNEVQEKKISGLIFMCNNATEQDCFQYSVFGFPQSKKDLVERVSPGMKLFLFNCESKLLHGVYLATSHGGMNLEPKAFTGMDMRGFPAQVRFRTQRECIPLTEDNFKPAIKENYNGNRFDFGLSADQVKKLAQLFRSVPKDAGKVEQQPQPHKLEQPRRPGHIAAATHEGREKQELPACPTGVGYNGIPDCLPNKTAVDPMLSGMDPQLRPQKVEQSRRLGHIATATHEGRGKQELPAHHTGVGYNGIPDYLRNKAAVDPILLSGMDTRGLDYSRDTRFPVDPYQDLHPVSHNQQIARSSLLNKAAVDPMLLSGMDPRGLEYSRDTRFTVDPYQDLHPVSHSQQIARSSLPNKAAVDPMLSGMDPQLWPQKVEQSRRLGHLATATHEGRGKQELPAHQTGVGYNVIPDYLRNKAAVDPMLLSGLDPGRLEYSRDTRFPVDPYQDLHPVSHSQQIARSSLPNKAGVDPMLSGMDPQPWPQKLEQSRRLGHIATTTHEGRGKQELPAHHTGVGYNGIPDYLRNKAAVDPMLLSGMDPGRLEYSRDTRFPVDPYQDLHPVRHSQQIARSSLPEMGHSLVNPDIKLESLYGQRFQMHPDLRLDRGIEVDSSNPSILETGAPVDLVHKRALADALLDDRSLHLPKRARLQEDLLYRELEYDRAATIADRRLASKYYGSGLM